MKLRLNKPASGAGAWALLSWAICVKQIKVVRYGQASQKNRKQN